MMEEMTAVLAELESRLNVVESSVHYGITPQAENARFAEHAAYAADAYAVGGFGIADLKEIIVTEVIERLAQKIAERFDEMPTEDVVNSLCDRLMELL